MPARIPNNNSTKREGIITRLLVEDAAADAAAAAAAAVAAVAAAAACTCAVAAFAAEHPIPPSIVQLQVAAAIENKN